MSKRVLLINPSLPSRKIDHPVNYLDTIIAVERGMIDKFIFDHFIWPQYKALGIERTFHQYPEQTASLGLLSLAAVLREANHYVDYVQVNIDRSNIPHIIERAAQYDIVGATAICTTIEQSLKILLAIKKRYGDDVTTVIGGPHVSYLDWKDIGNMTGIDILVRGEGEETIIRIAMNPTSADNLCDIEGIEFRNGNKIIRNPGINILSEQRLQRLPAPAYDLITDLENTQLYVQFSRGCDHHCFFCSENVKKRHFTGKQIETILYALEGVRKRNLIFVVDSTASGSPIFIDSFTKAVESSETTNYFNIQTRINGLSTATLQRMYRAHVVNYFFGIENTSDSVLKVVNKMVTWQDILSGLQIVRAFFMKLGYKIPPYRANFIQGLPGDDDEQRAVNLERRRYLLRNCLVMMVDDSLFQPTPGSTFYKYPQKFKLVIPAGCRTMQRGSLPRYNFHDTSMSQNSLFLHHLQMRQTTNDMLVDKFGLDEIRKTMETILHKGDTPERLVHYVRC